MSGDSALVERMSNAVRAAYKAMEILKDENRALKDVIEKQRKQLLELQASPISKPKPAPVRNDSLAHDSAASMISSTEQRPSAEIKHAEPKEAPIQKQTEITFAVPTAPVIPAKAGKEVGNSKFSFKSFLNAPDSKHFVEHIKKMKAENVHFTADSIQFQSTSTVCKALVSIIASYVQSEDTHAWRSSLVGEGKMRLIPPAVLEKLDLLVTMLVSMGSRGTDGLVQVMELLQVLQKVVLGAVRYQLRAPHYAVVMGALRVPRDVYHVEQRVEVPIKRPDCAGGAVGVDGGKDEAGSAPGTQDGDETEAQQSKKKQMAALASMFGMDSSDSDDDSDNDSGRGGGSDGGGHGSSGSKSKHRGDREAEEGDKLDTAADVRSRSNSLSSSDGGNSSDEEESGEEDEKSKDGAAMEVDGGSDREVDGGSDREVDGGSDREVDGGSDREGGAEDPALGEAQRAEGDRNKTKATLVDPLELGCRVYVLLAALVRLRANAAVWLLLDHIALVTTNNICDGCIIGVVSVLGSRRYHALQCAETNVRFTRLLHGWQRSLGQLLGMGGSSVALGSHADAVAQFARCEALLRCCEQHFGGATPVVRDTSQGPLDSAGAVLVSAWNAAEVDRLAVVRASRQVGFWGAVSHLCLGGSRVTGDPFSVLGLDRAGQQAARWVELLQTWHPFPDSGAARDDDTKASASELLQSEHFLLSEAQGQATAALREAGISTQKSVAQDILTEVFAKKWDRCLAQALQGKGGINMVVIGITRALQMASAVMQSAFETEYEAAEGGWRSGLSGDGFRLASRLDNRLTVGIALLNKLPFAGHFISSALGAVLQPSLQWQHDSSCTGRKLHEYAGFVDHCARKVFDDYSVADNAAASVCADADRETRTTMNKLYVVCAEIVALLALAGVENVVGVTASSLRGLLRSVTAWKGTGGVTAAVMFDLVSEIDRTLSVIPSPWAGAGRADVQCEMLLCARTVLRRFPHASTEQPPRAGYAGLAARALVACRPMPVFLINLDKRVDRLRRSLVMLAQANIAAVRIRAWDGTGDTAASAAEMFQRNFGGAGAGLVSPSGGGSNGGDGTQDVVVRREDDYNDIPESDVQLTWDSTVNSKFDARCAPNPAVIATASERACAASHLQTWRYIAGLCGIRASQKHSRATELALTSEVGKAPSPVEIFSTLRGTPQGDASISNKGPFSHYFPAHGDEEEFFVVLEDDVSFPQQSLVNLRASIRDLIKSLPADADILYLGGLLPKAAPEFHLQHKKNEPFFTVNYVWTLQAYVLRRRAVEVLLSKLPISAPVDNFVAGLIYAGELKACIAKDKLTQRVAPVGSGPRRNDSDVRPSGRSYDPSRKRTLLDMRKKPYKEGGTADRQFKRKK